MDALPIDSPISVTKRLLTRANSLPGRLSESFRGAGGDKDELKLTAVAAATAGDDVSTPPDTATVKTSTGDKTVTFSSRGKAMIMAAVHAGGATLSEAVQEVFKLIAAAKGIILSPIESVQVGWKGVKSAGGTVWVHLGNNRGRYAAVGLGALGVGALVAGGRYARKRYLADAKPAARTRARAPSRARDDEMVASSQRRRARR